MTGPQRIVHGSLAVAGWLVAPHAFSGKPYNPGRFVSSGA